MHVYDKARWQIEGGVSRKNVVSHFKFMFEWLNAHKLLNDYGLENLLDGINEESVLTDEMVTKNGKKILDTYYDDYVSQINYGVKEDAELLNRMCFKKLKC